ncbi:MAG: SEC-C domain-containing protein [Sedimentisphaerales bacterium]|nr:SEC-C domain-containing protein [Sedimentisphaerales bacterium]
MKKVGRNEPCPCGSGKKYKKCHGNSNLIEKEPTFISDHKAIENILKHKEAEELQRIQQQGKGRPIISTIFKGYRFVAVGNRFHYSKSWKTFHDFLFDYIKILFGKKWGEAEKNKDLENRHPILQWLHIISTYKKDILSKNKQEVISSPMNGATFAYLTLSYNLYLIAHNTHLVHGDRLHKRLIDRLKNIDSFYPAFYETMVASSFIKAGFQIELENEEDSASNHAEFTAVSLKTQKIYSVEAKHRQGDKGHTGIGYQVYKALKKDLKHERVVFINLNVALNQDNSGKLGWLDDVIGEMRTLENSELDGKEAPQAYIFITNHPFLYNLDSFIFPPAAVAEGFKIPDFKLDSTFLNLRDALKSRDNHIDMLDIMKAMREYDHIPETFDGDIPEYAFDKINKPRLIVGHKYLVPDRSGKEYEAILKDAIVMENEKKVYGIYQLDNGQQIMAACPLFDKELEVFKQYPDTFFGVYKKNSKEAKDPIDLFDFFHGVYRKSSKDKLLKFMEDHPDYEKLQKESQEELAFIYCERLVYSLLSQNSKRSLK